jgi:hypothetical protein
VTTYGLYFNVATSIYIKVEAETLEEAQELAYDEIPHDVCAQCSGWGQTWGMDLGEPVLDETAYSVDGKHIEVER